jgi:hypothetical protein
VPGHIRLFFALVSVLEAPPPLPARDTFMRDFVPLPFACVWVTFPARSKSGAERNPRSPRARARIPRLGSYDADLIYKAEGGR